MDAPWGTAPAVERLLVDGYRRMPPSAKLGRLVAMNRALEQLARARLRARYGPDIPEREMRLRLGALRLDPDIMRDVVRLGPARARSLRSAWTRSWR